MHGCDACEKIMSELIIISFLMHWQTRTHQTESEKNQDLLGFEPQTSRFPGEDSTTELHRFTWLTWRPTLTGVSGDQLITYFLVCIISDPRAH